MLKANRVSFYNTTLAEVMAQRQEEYHRTDDYKKVEAEFRAVFEEIAAAVDKRLALRLDSVVRNMEVINFDAGYECGITDLTGAATLSLIQYAARTAESAPTDK